MLYVFKCKSSSFLEKKKKGKDAEKRCGGGRGDVGGTARYLAWYPLSQLGGNSGALGESRNCFPGPGWAMNLLRCWRDPNQLRLGKIWAFCCLQTSLVEDVCSGFKQGLPFAINSRGDKIPCNRALHKPCKKT